jgi:hypothetical protein
VLIHACILLFSHACMHACACCSAPIRRSIDPVRTDMDIGRSPSYLGSSTYARACTPTRTDVAPAPARPRQHPAPSCVLMRGYGALVDQLGHTFNLLACLLEIRAGHVQLFFCLPWLSSNNGPALFRGG